MPSASSSQLGTQSHRCDEGRHACTHLGSSQRVTSSSQRCQTVQPWDAAGLAQQRAATSVLYGHQRVGRIQTTAGATQLHTPSNPAQGNGAHKHGPCPEVSVSHQQCNRNGSCAVRLHKPATSMQMLWAPVAAGVAVAHVLHCFDAAPLWPQRTVQQPSSTSPSTPSHDAPHTQPATVLGARGNRGSQPS